jgi:ribonuclease Z
MLGNKENIQKVIRLVGGSDVLYIEACFLERDKDRARDGYHLTAREAGRIAGEAGIRRLEIFHFSPRYIDSPGLLEEEAEEEFRMFQR